MTRSSCGAAIGGVHRQYVQGLLYSAEYVPLNVDLAEEDALNGVTITWARHWRDRVIVLYPPFMHPGMVKVLNVPTGKQIMRTDLLRLMEQEFGLKANSLSAELLQTLAILHENGHRNGALLPDGMCFGLSGVNMRYVIESCAGEIVDHPGSKVEPYGTAPELEAKLRRGILEFLLHSNRDVCASCHDGIRLFKLS